MYSLLQKSRHRTGPYIYVFIAGLFLAFHYFLITYINSTFLGKIIGTEKVGLIYAIGSIINIAIFLNITPIIKKYSTYKFLILASILEIISLLVLATGETTSFILGAFVLHHAISPVLLACLDVYLEDNADMVHIGKLRGTFLTILSIAAVVSPLAIGSLVTNENFSHIYLFSAFFMILFLTSIIINFRKLKEGEFKKIKLDGTIKEFFKDKDIRNITICSIILQFFYSWMIIYIPIYLATNMGFNWNDVALIISISLVPFLLFEIPVGEMADKKFDEKQILLFGFILGAFALALFPIIPAGSFFLWTLVILLARSGASIIEPTIESYFFRKSKGRDELIGIFRIGGPLAFIIGPTFGSIIYSTFDFKLLFPILSSILLIGLFVSRRLKDSSKI